MRTPVIAGNWKMNHGPAAAAALAAEIAAGVEESGVEVLVCPPFVSLTAAAAALQGSRVGLGAQDFFWRESGAYTGQISSSMIREAGATYVIIGHSERRGRFGVPEEGFTPDVLALFGETDATVNLKLHAALAAGLTPIVCVGETLAERRRGDADRLIAAQVAAGLRGLDASDASRVIIAYEPVWAIGTGETCAPDEAQRLCEWIRNEYGAMYGSAAAEAARVQYGGSVKAANAAELLSQPDIDGALVGGASLNAADFLPIVRAAQEA